MEWLLKFLPLLSSNPVDGSDGGGAGDGGSNGQQGLTDQQLEAALSSFLSKRDVSSQDPNSAAMAVFREFYPDNYELRRERNALKTQIETLQGQVVSEGDAALLTGVKELELDLESIKALKGNADTYAQNQRELLVTRIAQAGGYDADVLGTLLGGREPALAPDADPKKLESYSLKVNDADKPLKDWLEQDNAKFMPALKADGATRSRAPAGSGSAGGETDYVSNYITRRQGKADSKGS